MTRSRTRKSAKQAGARFETEISEFLAMALDDDRIERRRLSGKGDRGDIGGVRTRGQRVVVEVKNCARTDLAGWISEAHIEAGNDDALCGVVVSKRHGVGWPGEQWVHCTLSDLVALLSGYQFEYPEDVA